jgi:methionyl-tRNA formyltransferase
VRVVILTCVPRGLASRCLPSLCDSGAVEVAGVVHPVTQAVDRRTELRRMARKVRKIGVFGAMNGLRIRDWYKDDGVADIAEVADLHGVPVVRPPFLNSDETRSALRSFDADLGLSLGNAYIQPSVFSIPRLGMINVHMELLPEFRGALSVMWPIYEGHGWTGFTVHRINDRIDAGAVVHRHSMPIEVTSSLRTTVETNLAATRALVPSAVRTVCENYESIEPPVLDAERRRYYTTPTFAEYRRMLRNHRRMAAQRRPELLAGDPVGG